MKENLIDSDSATVWGTDGNDTEPQWMIFDLAGEVHNVGMVRVNTSHVNDPFCGDECYPHTIKVAISDTDAEDTSFHLVDSLTMGEGNKGGWLETNLGGSLLRNM